MNSVHTDAVTLISMYKKQVINVSSPQTSTQSKSLISLDVRSYSIFHRMFPQLSECDALRLTLENETVTLCSCSCQWRASITGARPVLCNCVEGVVVGSTGHCAGLSNEGNTTLPHTNTQYSHLQSQAPLPVSITPSVIDTRYSRVPGGVQAIKIYGSLASGIMLQLIHSAGFVYKTTRRQILVLIPKITAGGKTDFTELWISNLYFLLSIQSFGKKSYTIFSRSHQYLMA